MVIQKWWKKITVWWKCSCKSKTLIFAQLFNSHKDTNWKIQKEPLKSAKERPYINGEDLFNRKREHFTVLTRVKLNWHHRQSSTLSLAYKCGSGEANVLSPPTLFPFRLTFLLYPGTGNVTQYFWILTSRLTRGGRRCCWYRWQNYVQAQSCELICMYKRIQFSCEDFKWTEIKAVEWLLFPKRIQQ